MTRSNIDIAETFYTAMAEKNIPEMEKYIDPNVQFTGPIVQKIGKESYIEVVKNFTAFFNTLKIRAICDSGDHVMVAYDVDFPAPIGKIPSAALITLKEGLITKIELFFDARPFDKK